MQDAFQPITESRTSIVLPFVCTAQNGLRRQHERNTSREGKRQSEAKTKRVVYAGEEGDNEEDQQRKKSKVDKDVASVPKQGKKPTKPKPTALSDQEERNLLAVGKWRVNDDCEMLEIANQRVTMNFEVMPW